MKSVLFLAVVLGLSTGFAKNVKDTKRVPAQSHGYVTVMSSQFSAAVDFANKNFGEGATDAIKSVAHKKTCKDTTKSGEEAIYENLYQVQFISGNRTTLLVRSHVMENPEVSEFKGVGCK